MTESNRIVTGKCRASFVHLLSPTAAPGSDKAKFSMMLLVPKDDAATIKKLRDAEKVATEKGKDTKWGGKIPKGLGSIIRDADEELDLERQPEAAGHLFLNVSNSRKPPVVDRAKNALTAEDEVYSGMYVRASLSAFPYSAQGNKGVSFGLEAVQKLADGPSLGGGGGADDFDDLDDEDDDDLI